MAKTLSSIMRLSIWTACLVVAATTAQARDLTVAGFGGSSQDAQHKVFLVPFAQQTNIKVLEDTYPGGIGVLRTKGRSGNPEWDIVLVTAEEAVLGCEEGLFEKLDWNRIGPRTDFVPQAYNDCGVGHVVWTTTQIYDGNRFKDGPKSWADFWNLDKFPGKRGMKTGPKYTLEFALMADGVPLKDVYSVLNTPAGVDRAFKKLDRIKSNIVWWTAGAQPQQLLLSGEVALSVGFPSRTGFENHNSGKNFKVVWNESMYAVDFVTMMKGTPNKEAATKLINFWTRPENQSKIPPLSFQSVTNIKANKVAMDNNPDIVSDLPTYPANFSNALPFASDFWVDNIDQLNQRFNAWVAVK